MTALILNSGSGRRMGRLTADRPKCLIEVKGASILSRQMELLCSTGIHRVIVTTGPYDHLVREHIGGLFPTCEMNYVHNPRFADTNYIYSMHLAREPILAQDGIILLHGDIVISASVLRSLVEFKNENAAVVFPDAPLPEKDFKARIAAGRITAIGVELSGDDCVFLLPVYKLGASVMTAWMDEIGRFVDRGLTSVYAEDAFNRIAAGLDLVPFAARGLCLEIDTEADLRIAEERLNGE